MTAWLDENCGSDAWAMTPSGMRGVLNDAISIYFADATLASAFVARWCAGSKVETAGGVFQVREDEPAPRVGAGAASDPVRDSANFNSVSGVWLTTTLGRGQYRHVVARPAVLALIGSP